MHKQEILLGQNSSTPKWKCFTCTLSKVLIVPAQILQNAPELYHMDVDSGFPEPSHESMEVDSAQPNIVAGPSQIGS
jgi:hypothetical protein